MAVVSKLTGGKVIKISKTCQFPPVETDWGKTNKNQQNLLVFPQSKIKQVYDMADDSSPGRSVKMASLGQTHRQGVRLK